MHNGIEVIVSAEISVFWFRSYIEVDHICLRVDNIFFEDLNKKITIITALHVIEAQYMEKLMLHGPFKTFSIDV